MQRLTALVLVLLFAGSTAGADWLLCGAPPQSAAARHACCTDMQMAATTQQADGCCTLSQRTRERAPLDARIAPVLVALPLAFRVATTLPTPAGARVSRPDGPPLSPSIPIYLQQRALLI